MERLDSFCCGVLACTGITMFVHDWTDQSDGFHWAVGLAVSIWFTYQGLKEIK